MARRRKGRPIHGWVVLDKPSGMTSARAVAALRRHLGAAKAGHAGTLDPLATGVLPIALGEATKTMAYIVDTAKTYRFSVLWGAATSTDDAEGEVVETSAARPTEAAITAALAQFTGEIEQVPPRYSAIKVDGQRAYKLARADRDVTLAPRRVRIDSFRLIGRPEPDRAAFEVRCGKGTYMRSLARDLALAVGTVGHIVDLRRTAVGPFTEGDAISLDNLGSVGHIAPEIEHLLPVQAALGDMPALPLTPDEAQRLRRGQTVRVAVAMPARMTGPPGRTRNDSPPGRTRNGSMPPKGALAENTLVENTVAENTVAENTVAEGMMAEGTIVCAVAGDVPVALARIDETGIRPVRVLNLE